eukprot:1086350-Amorphochlora_amoeboformis.AAC.1
MEIVEESRSFAFHPGNTLTPNTNSFLSESYSIFGARMRGIVALSNENRTCHVSSGARWQRVYADTVRIELKSSKTTN